LSGAIASGPCARAGFCAAPTTSAMARPEGQGGSRGGKTGYRNGMHDGAMSLGQGADSRLTGRYPQRVDPWHQVP
jgi:hypothetical protein